MKRNGKVKALAVICPMAKRPPDIDFSRLPFEIEHIETIVNINEIEDRKFQSVPVFILRLDTIDSHFDKLLTFRSRFTKKKFVIQWHGSLDEQVEAGRRFQAQFCSATGFLERDNDNVVHAVELMLLTHRKKKSHASMTSSLSLADRIESAADGIADLRLNSTGHIVDELRNIAKDLRQKSEGSIDHPTSVDPRSRIKEALTCVAMIFDVIDSSRTAGMIVAGCVSATVGNCGWPSTACFSLAMSAWFGKDAFLAAVSKLPSVDSRTKPLLKYAKASPPRK